MKLKAVIGGPGTGKTTFLSHLYFSLEDPSKVIVTGTTESCIFAFSNKTGLKPKYANLRTVDGLCESALLRAGKISWREAKFLEPAFNYRMRCKIAKKVGLPAPKLEENPLSPPESDNINTAILCIKRAVANGLEPEEGVAFVHDTVVNPFFAVRVREAIIRIVELYKKGAYYDYPFLLFDALRHEIDIFTYRRRGKDYKAEIVFVDEAQDILPAFFTLLEYSEHIEEVLFVGDPGQGIYSFMGADPDLFLKKAHEIEERTESKRIGPPAIDVINDLLKKLGYKHKLKPADHNTYFYEKYGSTEELLKTTLSLLNSNKEVAILCRTNKVAQNVMHMLLKRNIAVMPIKSSFKAIVNEVRQILELYDAWRKGSWEAWRMLKEKLELGEFNLLDYSEFEKYKDPRRFLALLVKKLPFCKTSKGRDFVLRWAQAWLNSEKIVYVDTWHASKGLEWDAVVVYDFLPNFIWRKVGEGGKRKIREEGRALYVALTRGRREIHLISHPRKGIWSLFKYSL